MLINKSKPFNPLFRLSLGFILIAPSIFFSRDLIANFPLSSIIRDSGRFLVITSLGISLGIALSFTFLKDKQQRLLVTIFLLLFSYPFFSGKLYHFQETASSALSSNKNFRLQLIKTDEYSN